MIEREKVFLPRLKIAQYRAIPFACVVLVTVFYRALLLYGKVSEKELCGR